MVIDSANSLVASIQEASLLEPEIHQLTARLPGCPDPRELARRLIQTDWLTPFQLNRLLNGKGSELVVGPYQQRLGAGGMGQVFKARHAELRHPCQLKVIRKSRLGNPGAIRRFTQEAVAAAALRTPVS